MKLCLANVASAHEANPFLDQLHALWSKNFALVKQADTDITSRVCTWGIEGMDGFFYHSIDTLNAQAVFQAAVSAERDGADAVLVTCFGDPMLHQIRQAVNIPVASIGEASLLAAAMMGERFGIVHISEYNIIETKHKIHQYGLSDRLAGIRPVNETPMEQGGAIFNAAHAIEAFTKVGRELIADGAEVLIPACGLMSPALRLAPGVEQDYPNGFTELDGVPILDVMSCGIKMVETLYALKKCGSSWISRRNLYAQPTPAALESGKMVLKDDRMTFWDVSLSGHGG
jgi:allantoin racemase